MTEGGVRVSLMRGGTSRGVIVHRDDLPGSVEDSVPALVGIFGAPHANHLDGLGGQEPRTNKLAILGPTEAAGCDLDYLFGQVARDRAHIDFSGTCGNLSAAVALYAAQEGLCGVAADGWHEVALHDVNTGGRIVGRVALGVRADDGVAEPRTASGMPRTGTPVELDFGGMAGSATGALLPTGRLVDELALPDGGRLAVSVLDVANPIVFADAATFGLPSGEAFLEADLGALRPAMEAIRAAAAAAMGWADWDPSVTRLPFVMVVARATRPGHDGAGVEVGARMYAVNRFHEAIAGTGAANVAAAALLEGTVVHDVLGGPSAADADTTVLVHHGTGTVRVSAAMGTNADGDAVPTRLAYGRTARLLMQGVAFP